MHIVNGTYIQLTMAQHVHSCLLINCMGVQYDNKIYNTGMYLKDDNNKCTVTVCAIEVTMPLLNKESRAIVL